VFTVRRGAVTEEYGGERQTCEFDEGQFFEGGAWRIPYSHRAVLYYCKHFNIPMEAHKNVNVNAFTYLEGSSGPLGGRMRIRELLADMEGYTSELLAKAVDQGQLDIELSDDDRENLIDYLVAHGLISAQDLTYTGTARRGYAELPGAGLQPGVVSDPIPFEDLLPYGAAAMQMAGYYIGSVSGFTQQETMLQPVGGMSSIYEQGFQAALGDRIRFNSEVTEIRQDDNGVRIVYLDKGTGETTEATGDYCICTIPLSVLIKIPADFSSAMSGAMRSIPYVATGKMGLQFARRFWEDDDHIYGGITFTNNAHIGTMAYPDYDYLTPKGVIQAYYNFGTAGIEASNLSLQDRIELALEHGAQIHPQFRDEFETGFSVAWHRMPYALGGWPNYTERTRQEAYPQLLEPDGRIYIAGEHIGYSNGWQEPAVAGAWLQIEKLHERVAQNG
jgi:monoamine oxidase